jgi:hypothetical protein
MTMAGIEVEEGAGLYRHSPIELSEMIEMFYSALSVKQAMSHTWLLST